jgi:hypothetical protein
LEGSVITFSVGVGSLGAAGSDVQFEAFFNSEAGDVYKTPVLDPFGLHLSEFLQPAPPNSNRIRNQEAELGLWAPDAGGSLLPGALPDNLRGFEHDSILDYTDTDGDGMINNDAFFTLSRTSPTVIAAGADQGDILIARNQDASANFDLNGPGGGFNFNVFATRAQIGLTAGDGIDGLILSRTAASLEAQPFVDEALFSLDPLSPSVTGGGALPGAIYYTDFFRPFDPALDWKLGGSLFAMPNQIGLDVFDDLDGLDIFAVPEPVTVALLFFGWVLAEIVCRRPGRTVAFALASNRF